MARWNGGVFPCARPPIGSGRREPVRCSVARPAAAPAQLALAQQALGTHHVQHEDLVPIVAIKEPVGRLDDPAMTSASNLRRSTAAVGMLGELSDMREHPADDTRGGLGIFQRNITTGLASHL